MKPEHEQATRVALSAVGDPGVRTRRRERTPPPSNGSIRRTHGSRSRRGTRRSRSTSVYAKYGLDSEETAGLKARMNGWAGEIRTREAGTDQHER